MKHTLVLDDASKINEKRPVRVYRNLHQKCFSVKQGGVVVAHLTALELAHGTFQVSESGRKRVLRERKKNVHAVVVGFLLREGFKTPADRDLTPVRYNPYEAGHFVNLHDGSAVHQALFVSLTAHSILAVL